MHHRPPQMYESLRSALIARSFLQFPTEFPSKPPKVRCWLAFY